MGVIMKFYYVIAVLFSLVIIPIKQTIADNTGLVSAAGMGNKAEVLSYLKQGESIESVDQKGKTALIAASQRGHTDIVKLLLDKGALVNAKTTRGSTAFYYAAQNHHIDVLRLLHSRGADVNVINLNEFSPLSVAISNRDKEVVRLLLDMGADPNMKPTDSPLLTEAIARGGLEIFQAMLEKDTDVDATRDGYGETTLMIAVAMQHTVAVKLLLNRGANVRLKDTANKSVLHWFLCNTYSEGENIELLALLLDHNADYDGQASSLVGFKNGSTPLMCAVRRGFHKSVKMLLAKQPDVNRKNSEGHTALYYAVKGNSKPMIQVLLEHGADPALEAEVQRLARSRTDIGRLLLAALQPTLEARAKDCPEYNEGPARVNKHHQPIVKLDPLKSQNFPLARVEVLDAIPPVGQRFSLSPDGKWLIVREKHNKTPQEKSRRLVVYDIVNQQPYFFSPKGDFRVDEDRWLKDSSRYVLVDNYGTLDKRQWIFDVSSGQPSLQALPKPIPRREPLFAGGDPCPWRNDQGQVVLSRPNRDDRALAWSSDGKVVYSLKASGGDKYYLAARRDTQFKKLIRHSAKGLRDQFLTEFETELEKVESAEKRSRLEKLKAMIQTTPLAKLSASRFVLSPNDRYLYYRIDREGGPSFFRSSNMNVVVDLYSKPVQVWLIDKALWGTPQWHPNGRDLYFIDQKSTAQSDPNFPPMRQPSRWRLSVVHFP